MAAPHAPSPEPDGRRGEWLKLLDLSALGLVFPVALVLGYLAGRYLGGVLGDVRLGGLLGALLGLAAGFYNLFKVVQRLNREEAHSSEGDHASDQVSDHADRDERRF